MAHLFVVTGLVLEDGGDEGQAIAAMLHDSVEDAGGRPMLERIEEAFGLRVARIVDGCSDSVDGDPSEPWIGATLPTCRRSRTMRSCASRSRTSFTTPVRSRATSARRDTPYRPASCIGAPASNSGTTADWLSSSTSAGRVHSPGPLARGGRAHVAGLARPDQSTANSCSMTHPKGTAPRSAARTSRFSSRGRVAERGLRRRAPAPPPHGSAEPRRSRRHRRARSGAPGRSRPRARAWPCAGSAASGRRS